MGERGDIVRLILRELTARLLNRAGVEQVVTTTLSEPIVGRVIHRAFSHEHRERHYLMIDGTGGHIHYVDVGRGDGTPSVPEGGTVRLEPTKLSATQADRTTAAIAGTHGGRYSIDLHLAQDPNASEAFATSHVRRLEAMRNAGAGTERLADGRWTIADDHLAKAEAYAQRQQRDRPVTLSVLSRTPVADLASREAPTWSTARSRAPGTPRAKSVLAVRSGQRWRPGANG